MRTEIAKVKKAKKAMLMEAAAISKNFITMATVLSFLAAFVLGTAADAADINKYAKICHPVTIKENKSFSSTYFDRFNLFWFTSF